MESAITSRLISEAFMPSVPIVSPSLMAIVLNSMGVPPAARTPSFTLADRRRRWKLQGMVSIQVLATPIRGLRRSASVKPMALNMARDGARSRPSVIPRLRCFRSMGKDYENRILQGNVRAGEDYHPETQLRCVFAPAGIQGQGIYASVAPARPSSEIRTMAGACGVGRAAAVSLSGAAART